MLAHEFVDVHLPGLTPAAGVLAVYVARHTIGKGNPSVRQKLAEVAEGTGLCERTIRRCIAELGNVVAVHQESGKAPVWQFLFTADCPPPTKMSGVPLTTMSATPDKNVRNPGQKCRGYIRKKDPLKDPSKNIRSSGDEQRLAEFASFYQSYPRKVARPDAEKAYRQLTAAQRDVLTRNTPAWVDEFSRRPSDKVPYPATFLRRGMWEEPPPAPSTGPRVRSGADEILEAMRA